MRTKDGKEDVRSLYRSKEIEVSLGSKEYGYKNGGSGRNESNFLYYQNRYQKADTNDWSIVTRSSDLVVGRACNHWLNSTTFGTEYRWSFPYISADGQVACNWY